MEPVLIGLIVVAGVAAGAAVWLGVARAALMARLGAAEAESQRLRGEVEAARIGTAEAERRVAAAQVEVAQFQERLAAQQREQQAALDQEGKSHRTELEAERKVSIEKEESAKRERQMIEKKLVEFDEKFKSVFGSLAADALKSNREQFLALAEQKLDAKRSAVDELVKPIAETLRKTDEKLAVLQAAGTDLKAETGRLVRALSRPEVRGRYGEIQLRRVAELAGMTAYCDFCEQVSQRDSEGRLLRPDMIVTLPNERLIAVDAKTNTDAYVQAASASSPAEQEECLERFARHVSEQATALSKKGYWKDLTGSPDFVVMFVPGDQFLDAALARRPDLLDRAAEQNVVLASPSTLIGLLRAVAVGWREERMAKEAAALMELGRELHERAAVAVAHLAKMGRALASAVENYNEFVGSYERRLEPTLKKFEEAGVRSGKELAEMGEVTVTVRALEAAPEASARQE